MIYAQEYLPIDRDLRIVSVGYRIMGGFWRLQSDRGFHNNLSQGGQIDFSPIPPAAEALVTHLARELSINHGGFDIAMVGDHPYVLEFNRLFGSNSLNLFRGKNKPCDHGCVDGGNRYPGAEHAIHAHADPSQGRLMDQPILLESTVSPIGSTATASRMIIGHSGQPVDSSNAASPRAMALFLIDMVFFKVFSASWRNINLLTLSAVIVMSSMVVCTYRP